MQKRAVVVEQHGGDAVALVAHARLRDQLLQRRGRERGRLLAGVDHVKEHSTYTHSGARLTQKSPSPA